MGEAPALAVTYPCTIRAVLFTQLVLKLEVLSNTIEGLTLLEDEIV